MKRPIFWLVLLGATLQHCVEEGQDLNPLTVQFTCMLSGQSPEGGRQHAEEPTTLRISLEDNDGNVVFTLKEIQLLKLGDAYITEPLELLQGYYRITDFLLVAGNQVQYATPRRDSPLAGSVNSPLPFGLWVSKGRSLTVAMEVIDVTQQVPEDFGYASFFINVMNLFDIAVFTTSEQGYLLTDAKVRILKNGEVVKLPIGLPAEWTTNFQTRQISFPGNPDDTYLLEVKREGYATYRKWFVPRELKASLGNLPLKVYLVPAVFTMLAYAYTVNPNSHNFSFFITGHSGIIKVDWGDGTSDTYNISPSSIQLDHSYPSAYTYYPISVTGDLDMITGFSAFYQNGGLNTINVQGLTELKEFSMGLNFSPKVIDLSHNAKLESVWLPALIDLENLILPTDGIYTFVSISGPNKFSAAAVDKIVDVVYKSVVKNNRQGEFTLSTNWIPEEATLLGPPSAESLVKLRRLRDEYNWVIFPDEL